MKKGTLTGIILFVVLIIVSIYFLYPQNKIDESCISVGKSGSNPSLGPNDPNHGKVCCEGLIEIPSSNLYQPDSENADENGCVELLGQGIICSDCGNGNCEEWENICNCPVDCK